MSDAITQQADQAIRASDGERDQVVALLQRDFADGRLIQAELEERVGAALAARTRDQLRALTADLPGADVRPARPAMALDPCLLCLLLCLCPPAGVGLLAAVPPRDWRRLAVAAAAGRYSELGVDPDHRRGRHRRCPQVSTGGGPVPGPSGRSEGVARRAQGACRPAADPAGGMADGAARGRRESWPTAPACPLTVSTTTSASSSGQA